MELSLGDQSLSAFVTNRANVIDSGDPAGDEPTCACRQLSGSVEQPF